MEDVGRRRLTRGGGSKATISESVERASSNVLFFTDSFLPPSESFLIEQARYLTRYSPRFLACSRYNSKWAQTCDFPVRVLKDSTEGRFAELMLKVPRFVTPTLASAVRGCELIHAHFGKNGYVAWPLARSLKIPVLTTFHGFDATFEGNPFTLDGVLNQRMFFWRGRAGMARSDLKFIAVSNYIKKRMLNLGFSERNIFMHYIGIDLHVFSPVPEIVRKKNRVLCVSRFVEYKGHRFVIDALAKVRAGGIPVELVLVGHGPLRESIEREARQKIGDVIVLEDQSQDELRDLVRSSEVLVHGSITLPNGESEALGLAVIEAQAVGTPVVAFDAGGVAEGIDTGRSGYAVPPMDTVAMSAAVASLLTDPDRWHQFSNASISFVRKKFDIVQCTRELEDIYDQVVRDFSNSS